MAEPFPSPPGSSNYGSINTSTDDFLASLLGTTPSSASSSRKASQVYGGNIREANSDIQNRAGRSRSLTESIANSMMYATNATIRQIQKQRFISCCIFGCIFMFLFNLIFLPRTSLDRDLRRFHGEFLTFDDCSRLFLTHLNFRNNARNYMEFSQNQMHIPGDNYEELEDLFKTEFKFKTTTDKYETWVSKPIDNYLRMRDSEGNVVYEANLKEGNLLSFHPYSANGTVTAQFVYAKYGTIEDFDQLSKSDIQLKDRIMIIRSGKIHTSRKIKNAQDNGALGVIVYSDPEDDGEFTEANGYKSFPSGPARTPYSINKDTANFIIDQPGDPTTPGWSSTLFSHRIKPETIPKIPSLPMSYEQILPVLANLKEGESHDYQLELGNLVQFKIKPIYNIINEIKGIIKDEEIIVGASRDVIGGLGGATDGHTSLLELARGLNELVKLGWKPLRTIKLVSWDGASYGYLGSTEYGEFYSSKLNKNTIAYINLDKINGSKMKVEANPLFNKLLIKVMKEAMFDEKRSLYNYFHETNSTIELISNGLGDYSVFQNHLGIPSLNIGFENVQGVDLIPYHNSKYDSIDWFEQLNPDFKYPNLISQFVGLFVLNLCDREIVHIQTYDYFNVISKQFTETVSMIPDYWMDRIYDDESNVRLTQKLEEIQDLFDRLLIQALKFDVSLDGLQQQILQDYPWFKLFVKIKIAIKIKVANLKIRSIDRIFLSGTPSDTQGDGILKSRKWFRHMIFAPNYETGNTVELLPGLSENLDSLDYDLFVHSLYLLNDALMKLSARLLL
ncbi:hypothetical protein CANARDRAFT_27564 [[Candida] arabinofermentans NRRL YB-2248]|uniref:Peptide hydrolase n=1 Tax=[Candida] arabinofermentans NRRL YB-2248 TaxID=983967 RepID=A0A1E4T3N6_9ASCO|nr:hypothetical protein CANARDRAFT_27564 [[Candida] arabinofermentans NRRL YB-2248]